MAEPKIFRRHKIVEQAGRALWIATKYGDAKLHDPGCWVLWDRQTDDLKHRYREYAEIVLMELREHPEAPPVQTVVDIVNDLSWRPKNAP